MSWLDRQSFLGAQSERRLGETTIGLAGCGGGNSHVAQQLAHAGVGRFVLVDDDLITLSNLNRLIGGTWIDIQRGTAKVEIMRRMILAINPRARVKVYRSKWQLAGEALSTCDVIVGGLDSVRSKDELDAFCRRLVIPYIDQGMDVHHLGDTGGYLVAGQVVLSQPGSPCLRCLGIVTEGALAEEARNYGAAGGRPQVVWPNGVLASLAVGLAVQLVAPWQRRQRLGAYLSHDGNTGKVVEAPRFMRQSELVCSHYPPPAVGDMTFDIRKFRVAAADGKLRAKHWASRLFGMLRSRLLRRSAAERSSQTRI
ncbi:ThiF family adenylyltransferase [Mesorhizobium sp. M00.F.Ca.ET.186.01.1.1]|nr:ThiF family adenylyltransferase [bacterium M00.F.Ca.ET.205.01.1.1]TGU55938.1 ThiF family adenylyltransferase [bacterium M00.F.Ca.ET.152.01.1.1]TGV39794.1 ThiF family adenylyltransferase [Mesorhizobium sp. M00.F.Ca.ET.186.01.1.1]TGZ44772.1 ThiF family adenylyltransferase [bacterium M00.F.Ca.ET.162.01.1.1]